MPRTPILAAVAAIAIAIAGYFALAPEQTAEGYLPPLAANAQGASASATASAAEAGEIEIVEMVKGAEDAPITVIEYASFTCPHCATFHASVMPQLEENYIDEGLVRFVYREVYFDRYGLWAGMVARCAGPMRYFGVVDMLYEDQREWTRGEPVEIADNLRRIGRRVGLSDDDLDSCLTDAAMAEALVGWYEENAAEHDVTGTPSFVVNGEKYSNMNYESFAGILDGILDNAQ